MYSGIDTYATSNACECKHCGAAIIGRHDSFSNKPRLVCEACYEAMEGYVPAVQQTISETVQQPDGSYKTVYVPNPLLKGKLAVV